MPMRKSVTVKFGERVRTLRHAAELSQEALSAKCGLDRTYISGIERGLRNVSLKNIESIAKALGVSLANLFTFETTPK